jgi:hypothetical protein
MQPPVWFHDSAAKPVVDLLRWFILQLNILEQDQRNRKLTRKLTAKTLPALFDYGQPDDIDFLKEALQSLAETPYNIWNLSLPRGGDSQTTVIFNYAAEPVAREWLNMPRIDPAQQAWIDAIAKWQAPIGLDTATLTLSNYPGVYPPEDLLHSLTGLIAFVHQNNKEKFSWRRLSAGFFFGDSKYLDSISRQQWLLSVCPRLLAHIESRTLLLNVFLVDEPEGILLIENQDTFCWLMKISADVEAVRHLTLVYSQGFMGSAQRSRDVHAVQFMYEGRLDNNSAFQEQWFPSDTVTQPIYFWGDLDYAGIAIIKSLRQVFPSLTAWVPGYQPMLEALREGAGHTPFQATKMAQVVPDACGCDYADRELLPELMQSRRFIDQEWVTWQMLTSNHNL